MDRQAIHRARAKRHAEKRAAERFNASPELVKRIARIFKRANRTIRRNGKVHTRGGDQKLFIVDRHGSRLRGQVIVDGTTYVAIYDEHLKTVVTVLPIGGGTQQGEEGGEHHGQEESESEGQEGRLLVSAT